ncbi:hypothetical protein Hdeb2414_s0005g00165471 [Helianthus debilis subsp. tardiflorus]
MMLHLFIFSVILIITSPSSTSALASCTRVCNGGDRENSVSYPFGFSDGCEIRLNCSDAGEIRFGEYNIQNITSEHIQINIPANCGRQFEEIRQFNSTNFAPTSRNGFLLSNCSSTLSGCAISPTRAGNRFNFPQCDSRINRTMDCYSEDNPQPDEFINLKTVEAARCELLVSSALFDMNGSGSPSRPGPSEFQAMELGWWLRGECSCDKNAVCRNVSFENQTVGYRCYCNHGYDGDGFIDGDGCREG